MMSDGTADSPDDCESPIVRWPGYVYAPVGLWFILGAATLTVRSCHWYRAGGFDDGAPWRTDQVNISAHVAGISSGALAAVSVVALFTLLLAVFRRHGNLPKLSLRYLFGVIPASLAFLAAMFFTDSIASNFNVGLALFFVICVIAALIVGTSIFAFFQAIPKKAWRYVGGGLILGVALGAIPLAHAPDRNAQNWFNGHKDPYFSAIYNALTIGRAGDLPSNVQSADRALACSRLIDDARLLQTSPTAKGTLAVHISGYAQNIGQIGRDCPPTDEAKTRLLTIFSGPDAAAIDLALKGKWHLPLLSA